jgi:hypothetical protein
MMQFYFHCSPESIQDKVGRVLVDGIIDANAWYKGKVSPILNLITIDHSLHKETTPDSLATRILPSAS